MDVSHLAAPLERALRALRPLVQEVWDAPPGAFERKADRTVVTELDRQLEDRLAEALLALDPTFGFVGEEGGERRPGRPTWYVDPLDGTLNFSRRLPWFAMQAALVDGDQPILAAIYEPLPDDFAWAARGVGAFRQGRPIRVATRPLEDALLFLDLPRRGRLVREPDLLPPLRRAVYRARAVGTIALMLRDVACGAADAFYGSRDSGVALHDLAPGLLLVREAGGVVTDERGGDVWKTRTSLLAAAPETHRALLPLVRPPIEGA